VAGEPSRLRSAAIAMPTTEARRRERRRCE